MGKDVNIVSKSNELRGEGTLDALSDDNIGPLASALRQHIKDYYGVQIEGEVQDQRVD